MAIKAYVGRMGSGKSYEVVSNVIIPALGRGRRVITNIAGVNYELIKEHLIAEKIPEEKVGQLVSVSHDQISDPQFWLTDKDDLSLRDAKFMLPGDLVCLDEIWRFYEGFKRPPERVLNFVRMHRHMLDEKGVSSDLALVTQDIMDIGPPVRRVIEETFRMTKLTMIGSAKKYRIDVYSGAQQRDEKPLRSFFRSYDPKFFPMYSSHSLKKEGQEAKEENIDQRGNILNHWGIKYGVPVGILAFIAVVWLGVSSFSKMATQGQDATEKTALTAETKTSETRANAQPQNPVQTVDVPIRAYASGSFGTVIVTELQVLLNPPSLKITPLTVETYSPTGRLHTTEVRKNVKKSGDNFMSSSPVTTGTK
jgi:zona occludens toxin (predicted ATPase)